ncbi:MAG: hypothetical protein EBU68_01905 [Actinobacteria bacterium]|nr:hypothetical protein [Actinomycetota bacterium]NCW83418.1 hypothetical protein [Acidimicrobiia bacterium]NDC99408.1 hypothetical protein [bacterium]NBO97503.1 hypothetical protein [Actinomycetota bacterium]NBP41523.1 hypothetical protein [Actinomycetota bacterium]
MFVTRHSNVVDPALREKLWRLYRTSYLPTAEATVTHEMLDQDEFNEQISRDSNRVWVVWCDSLPVAMTLVSTDVRATRWLSDIYFQKQFPDRFHAGQVHYIVWVVVDPVADAKGANVMLARQALTAEARDGALLVFDVPELHQPSAKGGAAELLFRMAQLVGDVELLPLSTQRYFALDFARIPAQEDHQISTPQNLINYS